MAVSDFTVIVSSVILNRIAGIYFPFTFLSITHVCRCRAVLNCTVFGVSVWLTVAFTFDRYVAICCQNLKTKYCRAKTAAVAIVAICICCFFASSFLYLIYKPLYVINDVPWFCGVKVMFYTSPVWIAYDWIIHISIWLSFILIILLNALTIRHIRVANRARRRLRSQKNGENESDPEMEKRRKSIVLLVAISGSFILSYVLTVIAFLYVRIAGTTYFSGSNFEESNYILEESGIILQVLSYCSNPFIYAGTQSKFRDELRNGVKYPFILIRKIFK
ncbi:uncharacterized protein [Scyliorhinus torazame]|uniref:uncharacterized protein n=1 Tax=Scyliorhinus torazame TaxID=75743 RepID=UPI003B599F45